MTDLEITRPALADYDEIQQLWVSAFGDSPDYVRFFLKKGDPSETGLLLRSGGRAASMLFLLPSVLRLEGRFYPCRYLYAAATHPEFQGRGFFSLLEEEACRLSREEGVDFIGLVPAAPSLFRFYQKFGYRIRFYQNQSLLAGGKDPGEALRITPCSADDFLRLRWEWLQKRPVFFEFASPFDRYRYEELRYAGGEVFLAEWGEESGYFAGEMTDRVYRIRETSLSLRLLSGIGERMRSQRGFRQITLSGGTGIGVRRPYGMLKCLNTAIPSVQYARADGLMSLMLN